jgi:hypothetical protein
MAVRDGPGAHVFGFSQRTSPLFEIALVLVRLDHVARFIVNADHGIV